MTAVGDSDLRRMAVVGAGTMGHGIAQVGALAGVTVRLYDLAPAFVERGLARLRNALEESVSRGKLDAEGRDAAIALVSGTSDLEAAVAEVDVVIEAVSEDLDLKRRLFSRLDEVAPDAALLASNTSSLSIAQIAAAARRPERIVGMHFFNPPSIMRLVEVVRGEKTAQAVVERACAVVRRLAKEPIVVRDSPGFASSRLGIALGLEAIRMLEAGVASADDIDRAMELGYRHPMGPLKLTDLVGLDVRLAIAEYLERELGERFRPPELLKKMVKEGKLGKKSGEGFYKY